MRFGEAPGPLLHVVESPGDAAPLTCGGGVSRACSDAEGYKSLISPWLHSHTSSMGPELLAGALRHHHCETQLAASQP